MGIAIAPGVPVAAGLITGILGGLVVGCLVGCPLQVSGPGAALTVIVFEVVQRFGFEMLGLVVWIGGAMQLAAGMFELGQWFRAVSPAAIKGMLAGIGVLIFASQFHVMVDDRPKANSLTNHLAIPAAVGKAMTWPDGELHRRQAAIAEYVAEWLPDHASADELAQEEPDNSRPRRAALQALLGKRTTKGAGSAGAARRFSAPGLHRPCLPGPADELGEATRIHEWATRDRLKRSRARRSVLPGHRRGERRPIRGPPGAHRVRQVTRSVTEELTKVGEHTALTDYSR